MRFRSAVPSLGLLLLLGACGSGPSTPPAAPSVLVSVVQPHWGTLPRTVTAFGAAAPALTGTETISVQQPGQLTRLFVTPGAAVRAGQALAVFTVAPTARSTYQQAANALRAAQQQRAATAQLLSQQLATSDQLAQADKTVADARDALAALGAEGAGQATRTLTAPFDGVVTTITAAQGDRTQGGAPLLTVARGGDIVVSVGVDPAQRSALAVGQAATLQRLTGGETLAGHVVRVDSQLNARTRLVDVDISFPAGRLLPGEAMQVSIQTGQVAGWIVPHRAVVTAGGPVRLFQVVGGKAKAVPAHTLLTSDTADAVSGPVDARRPLIVDGAYQVSDGDAVRNR